MQSRTELNHNNQFTHKQNLPRGYFKKRKHELHERPPPNAKMTPRCNQSVNFLDSVNATFYIFIILIMEVIVSDVLCEVSTIGPDLKVLSLERTGRSETIVNGNVTGICGTIDIRFDPELEKLRNCRVVEGSVSILLLDDLTEDTFRNFSFPELVEITGFLMLYRISGLRSLYDLFPNLAVIRGRDIFKDYSLIIYELVELEDIGLVSLTTIERGNVRIEKNDRLCFADKIQWSMIAGPGEHYIAKNKLPAHCPHCSKDMNCPTSRNMKSSYCWNQQFCQIECPSECKGSCTKSKKCCHESCLGGCDEDNLKKCKACKKFAIGDSDNFECSDSCPEDTYEYLQRRCVTKKQCYDIKAPSNTDAQNTLSFIPYNRTCMLGCPPAYVDFKLPNGELSCKTCEPDCLKKCQAKIIDSISAAQSLKGCSIIEGPLEIQIRSAAKTVDSTNNVVKELEKSLSDIVVIDDYLKIARSFPIVSLSFLKNLRVIKGKQLESNKYSLVIWDNQNLQELWEEKQEVKVEKGKLFFHFNPKLCFYKIEHLTKNQSQIENYETASKSNGDKISCNVTTLYVTVAKIYSQAALLTWAPLQLEDERLLLRYEVFHLPASYTNVTLWEGRDACGNDGWLVNDVKEVSSKESMAFPITKLEPYTQYAYYIKAYTLATEKTGAQSNIEYFRTLPGQPQAVFKLKATPKSSSSVEITWEPPRKVNGKLSHYILRAKMILEKSDQILERDYCEQPFDQAETTLKNEAKIEETPKPTSGNGLHCDCDTCQNTCQKPPNEGAEQRQSAIDFENEIQDYVYVRNEVSDQKVSRAKRQSQVFPEDLDKTPERRNEPDTNSQYNEAGEFTYFYQEISLTQTTFELDKLRHYTNYQIFVRACREKSDSVPDNSQDLLKMGGTEDAQCSPETQISVLTMKQEENDKITIFEATGVPSNNSLGSIKVTWRAPENPNGLLLSYTIKYKKDIEHTKGESHCIPHKMYLNQSFHIIRGLSNGNYSVQIAATSMAGTGNYTSLKFVSINEKLANDYTLMLVLVLICLLFIFIVILVLYVRRHYNPISSMKLITSVNPDYAGISYKEDGWEVPREKILLLHELGQGSFGMVYEGIIKDIKIEGSETRCAIKTVNDNATDKERISFLNEASVMKQFDCAFVVRLLGVVSTSQPTFVVMELMANGDLKGYLRSHRPEYDTLYEQAANSLAQPPTLRQFLQMAAEIADGMSYLTVKKFVHRDLAARNCMVAEDLTVKIGDFGMTRDIYETDYYRKGTKGLLPVRWMSPESLKDGVFTSSSDVFSYGVVLWEMATLASQPYQGLSNDQVLRYVIDGGVMERPENCPDKLYELMRRCWQHRPSGRPTFFEIIELLLEDVNQNFRNIAFYFTKEGQDALNQQRQGDFAVNITDDVTTPLRQGEEETSSIDGNNFLMDDMNSDRKLH